MPTKTSTFDLTADHNIFPVRLTVDKTNYKSVRLIFADGHVTAYHWHQSKNKVTKVVDMEVADIDKAFKVGNLTRAQRPNGMPLFSWVIESPCSCHAKNPLKKNKSPESLVVVDTEGADA